MNLIQKILKHLLKMLTIITFRSLKSGANQGCRLTGGGFGGFTVSLIEKNKYDTLV